jgi:hypothetical protein
VIEIEERKIIFDKGEIIRNGAALHLDQGMAVTSHASQAKTVDQVIVSVPVRSFSQANEAQFYVSMYQNLWASYLSAGHVTPKVLLPGNSKNLGYQWGCPAACPC